MFFTAWLLCISSPAQKKPVKNITVSNAGLGWAGNSVNTVVFRKNSLTSNGTVQFIAYYDDAGFVVIGKRNINDTAWQLQRTEYKGNITDAHNSISIILDGDGYLHMAWDHHNNALRYCKSKAPLSLELTEKMPMTGDGEKKYLIPSFIICPMVMYYFFTVMADRAMATW